MRYPEGSRRSNSINLSEDGNFSERAVSSHQHPLRLPSSSSGSRESEASLHDAVEVENDLPGRNPDESGPTPGPGDRKHSIETISEHVLFGNNNGHNSFLYLYYSSSSSNRASLQKNNFLKRPYTTGGAGCGGDFKGNAMGSHNIPLREGSHHWNERQPSGTSSLGPSPILRDEEEDEFRERKSTGPRDMQDANGNKNETELTPYPVYMSPMEGSPARSSSSSSEDSEGDEEDTRTSSRITGGPRTDRLDSFGADLLDDDWDKAYSVRDVDANYVMSPDPGQMKRRESDLEQVSMLGSNKNSLKRHTPGKSVIKQQSSTTSSNNLSVSKSSIQSSARSGVVSKQNSIKRVRVADDPRKGSHGTSMNKWSSTSSVTGRSQSKLTPLSSSGPSRTPSTRSLKQGSTPRHGVTHHHKPLSGSEEEDDDEENPHGSTTTDHMDQMSFQFRNGIGAFFGTEASRRIAQKHEPTPEEMYEKEMQSWRPRLATGATIFFATLFILSSVSLLFVFPILVDPILVGFEAQFSREPVLCRTTNFRNGSGPSECATPSCREGCTLDLFSCIFVDVEYFTLNDSTHENLLLEPHNVTTHKTMSPTIAPSSQMSNATFSDETNRRSAILLINVNGCGYPPEVTCSDFERKYASINTHFPCYYSTSNESIVVPHYSRSTEIIHLTLAICVPCGTIIISGTLLYILVKYHKHLKVTMYETYATRKREARERRREERARDAAEALADMNRLKRKEEAEQARVLNDVTSISERTPAENHTSFPANVMQNGASKTGSDSRNLFDSAQA